MSDRTIDVQLASILSGLRELREVLDEPLTQHALDIKNNAHTKSKYAALKRLQRSLTQYSERSGQLFYVGAVGHFSSGKSSTINSILDIWGTEFERDSEQNPTDDTITLITRGSNRKALLGIVKEGNVTIRTQEVDVSFLDHLVLVDTPGTGDPELLEEIARDFLPICDLILFFFSAAVPLDQADVPLLEELHKQLPFIPIQFVITRADEFSKDRMHPVSADNFDGTKRAKFLQGVVFRVNKLLSPKIYTEHDFILIDNIQRFNIKSLRELIVGRCDPANPQNRIEMHSHKVKYFEDSAESLQEYFDEFLDEKMKDLTRVVNAAGVNVGRYNANVRISNSNLTKFWFDQHAAVRAEQERVSDALPIVENLPSEIEAFDQVAKSRAEIDREYVLELGGAIQQASASLRLEIAKRVRSKLANLNIGQLLSHADSGDSSPIELRDADVRFESAMPILPFSLSARWQSLRELEATVLRVAASDLRAALEDAAGLLAAGSPWVMFRDLVVKAQAQLTDDLFRFFEIAELYRAGVFSRMTKGPIGALGLGKRLDDLEEEFGEHDKTQFENAARDGLFPQFEQQENEVLKRISAIEEQVRPLLLGVRELKIPSPQVGAQSFAVPLEAARESLRDSINTALRDDLAHFSEKLKRVVAEILTDARRKYSDDISAASRAWWMSTALFLAGGVMAGVLIYFSYLYLTNDVPPTIFHVLMWNVVAQLITAPISLMLARLWNNFPKTSRRIRFDVQANTRRELEIAAENLLETHEFSALRHSDLISRMSRTCSDLLGFDPDGWLLIARDRLTVLRNLSEGYTDAYAAFLKLVETTSDSIAAYFGDSGKNLELLNGVADQIKQRAIEPSFNFLEETSRSLDGVKRKIQAVEF